MEGGSDGNGQKSPSNQITSRVPFAKQESSSKAPRSKTARICDADDPDLTEQNEYAKRVCIPSDTDAPGLDDEEEAIVPISKVRDLESFFDSVDTSFRPVTEEDKLRLVHLQSFDPSFIVPPLGQPPPAGTEMPPPALPSHRQHSDIWGCLGRAPTGEQIFYSSCPRGLATQRSVFPESSIHVQFRSGKKQVLCEYDTLCQSSKAPVLQVFFSAHCRWFCFQFCLNLFICSTGL